MGGGRLDLRAARRRGDGWIYAHVQDITASGRRSEAVARQARQQAAVAALGRFALDEQDLEAVMDRVAETVAETLEIELCEVLEITPRGSALRLVAGVGWPEGQVRRALVPAGPGDAGRLHAAARRSRS